MKLVRWSPLGLTPTRDMARMRDDMDRLFDSFLTHGGEDARTAVFVPPADIEETAEDYRVRLDLPGVSQKDVKVQLTGDALLIRGERHAGREEKNGNVIRSERFAGSFERTFTLTAPVQADKVSALYKDGVLEIRIPKAEAARVREIPIQAQ